MNKCKNCNKGVLVHIHTVSHVVDGTMIAGDVYQCTRCGDKDVKTRVYMLATKAQIWRAAKIGL